ncbi:MFS transporter [Bacillus sonorensis]|uniref:MFS transporter n=1 Tax=Bacillus sonorensis TaxID=119858 RepID=UPI002281A9E7|nr:MFS transporter [Bacillus sonorensis]MCY8023861.1 MFS transporter [Bacillus sonorensis]MCY8033311.1 MFS transporter [Bacillus sonorensis]MCY8269941.1 MFS transporter [Bacillus sonorensis]MCY8402699.1 MFS transporter [Bacillus sonorensis]MCY8561659.1 MFS transporter [Bacillus sonorensis]
MKISKKSRALFLTTVASGTMLNPLNSSMISLALHSIQKEFELSFSTVSWLISSFYLASAVAQPVTGKLGDIIGRKKLFLFGLILVAVSALGAPLAPAFMVLLVMRLFQAIGSSAIYPSGVGLIRSHIHDRQASALAVLSIFASAMTALGPTVGGFLIVWGGWQAIFTVNFPFILFSFLLGMYMFPKDEKKPGLNAKAVIRQLDLTGILLFAGGIVLLLSFLLSLSTDPHYAEGICGFVLLFIFVWWELRTDHPFIDMRLFVSHRALSSVYVQFIMLNIFNYCLFFGLPSYFQDEMQLSVQTSGLLMLFMSGMSIIVSPLAGKWIDRSGETQPVLAGACLMIAGAVLMTLFFVQAPMIWKGLILSLLGISYGLGNVALQSAMLTASPSDMIGTSSGLFQTCRYLGSILSSVILGLLFGQKITAGHFRDLGMIMVIVAIGSLIFSFRFVKLAKDLD